MAGSSTGGQEWTIHVPKVNPLKKYSLFRFNKSLDVDVTQWADVTLQRENNRTVYEYEETKQTYGEGSEYNKSNRMEARRKKMGMKDGGAGEHADFWVFTKSGDGQFNAHKIDDWYSFMPVVQHKTFDIDQAEEQFVKLMTVQKDEEGGDGEETAKIRNLKVSDRDDAVSASDSDADDDEKPRKKKSGDLSDDDEGPKKKKTGKKKAKPKKTSKFNEEEGMAVPDSDDGDEEGEEVDYMSDSEDSAVQELEKKVAENEDMVGVGDETRLRALLSDEEEEENGEESLATANLNTDERKGNKDSDSGSDSDDPDEANVKSAVFLPDRETRADPESTGPDTPSSSAAGGKRKAGAGPAEPDTKKIKTDAETDGSGEEGLTEMAVRRYLLRKPHSTKELISKFKVKCIGMNKDQIVKKLALILQILKPSQEKRAGTLYFSLKLD